MRDQFRHEGRQRRKWGKKDRGRFENELPFDRDKKLQRTKKERLREDYEELDARDQQGEY